MLLKKDKEVSTEELSLGTHAIFKSDARVICYIRYDYEENIGKM
jgi:hypothetical protein